MVSRFASLTRNPKPETRNSKPETLYPKPETQTSKPETMKVTRFEDLEIWQLARELCKVIFKLTLKDPFCHDFKLKDQIKGSSGSVMDNIAEGFDRGGNKEFGQFLSMAKGSTGEARSQSYRAYDYEYISEEQLNDLLERTDTLSRKIYNLMESLKNSEIKGIKYK